LIKLLVLALFLAPTVVFADYYKYEQDNGTVAFCDAEEKIAERYKDRVETIEEGSLWDYKKTTIIVPKQDELQE
jgi:hypothetical protein